MGRPLFLALYDYFLAKGSVFKLAFGPKTFYVVSDPVVAKHVLRTSNLSFDKGLLAEILAPIMGTGLIPADFETWRTRRKALVPGFHSAWLSNMMGLFAHCCGPAEAKLDAAAAGGAAVDMEALFCSLSLDIIGLSVFNYPFGSVTTESPLIRAVYNVLREAEHRSTFYFPYWNIPGADLVVPRQVAFRRDMAVINDTLAMLIASAQACASVGDLAELEARDYDNVKDPSLLRFLVDLRGEKTTNAQLRDDLVTMLIAGHETTAAVLTWALFQLAQHPASLAALRAELDEVLPGGRAPVYGDVPRLLRTRLAVAESLRLYPQPPILIRRALEEVQLPRGGARAAVTLPKGADVFIRRAPCVSLALVWLQILFFLATASVEHSRCALPALRARACAARGTCTARRRCGAPWRASGTRTGSYAPPPRLTRPPSPAGRACSRWTRPAPPRCTPTRRWRTSLSCPSAGARASASATSSRCSSPQSCSPACCSATTSRWPGRRRAWAWSPAPPSTRPTG